MVRQIWERSKNLAQTVVEVLVEAEDPETSEGSIGGLAEKAVRGNLSGPQPGREVGSSEAPTFSIYGEAGGSVTVRLLERLKDRLHTEGYEYCAVPPPNVRLVLNVISPKAPRLYRRKAHATLVVSILELDYRPENILLTAYPFLVRSLANLLVLIVRADGEHETHFVTPEQGHYRLTASEESPGYIDMFYARLKPIATSQLVIDNEFHADLPESLWDGDAFTAQLYQAGRRLEALDLLPAPFPIDKVLPPRDLRHFERLFSMGGLSYGNLGARRDLNTFWMSASGVNKAELRKVGEHVLLVKGFDAERNVMLLSVPPGIQPRRVSVDAIEHYLIYREHPQVGAIVHVHAWMDGIVATEMNYPCGTIQLAQAVADLVRKSPDPARAVIGLKNHGLTITGPNLDDILARIEGRIIPQVPMS